MLNAAAFDLRTFTELMRTSSWDLLCVLPTVTHCNNFLFVIESSCRPMEERAPAQSINDMAFAV